jgi:immunoglobulin-binding protein 1
MIVPQGVTLVDDHIYNKLNVRENVFRPTNLPVMTLDEFATKEKARMEEQERQQEEAKKNMPNDDSDDEETADRKTYEARYWDDWKDLNEKGSGNKRR